MAAVIVQMKGTRQYTLEEIHGEINEKLCGKFRGDIDKAEEVAKTVTAINDVEIWTLAYEKYYSRVHSCAALTVVMAEHEQEQTACVIACAGGSGYANYSWGTNRDFAKLCVQVLEAHGFCETEADWGKNAENTFDRFLRIFD